MPIVRIELSERQIGVLLNALGLATRHAICRDRNDPVREDAPTADELFSLYDYIAAQISQPAETPQ